MINFNNSHIYWCFLFVIICLGCKNVSTDQVLISNNEDLNTSQINTDSTLNFISSARKIDSNKPIGLSHYYNFSGSEINKYYFDQLKLEPIFGSFNTDLQYKLISQINSKSNFKILWIRSIDVKKRINTYLITYNAGFEIIDFKQAGHAENTDKYILLNDKIYVECENMENVTEHRIDENGKFVKTNRPVTFKHYLYPKGFGGEVYLMPHGFIKPKSGTFIRDSLGNPIRELAFGDIVYIVDYVNEASEIVENKKARVVINEDSVQTGEDFYIDPSNIGYVFTKDLLSYNSYHDEVESHYSYESLYLGEKGNGASILLGELVEIQEVDLKNYEHQIIEKPTFVPDLVPMKKDRKIKLTFDNGEIMILKDTTYLQYEYKPTRSYQVGSHPDFEGAYLVSENMFFTDDIYTVISKKDGDTLQQFTDYPHISPDKSYSVSVFYDQTECIQETGVSITRLVGDRYVNYVYYAPNSWSYPFKVSEYGIPIDDFYIGWLSDNEFIIKVKNPEDCYLEETNESFYLKFRIK